jgi:hypothetical protein
MFVFVGCNPQYCDFTFDFFTYIPDRDANGRLYVQQVQKLKCLIAACIDKQQLCPAIVVKHLFSSAVLEFSKNALAKFDFMDIARPNKIQPESHAEYMVHFFVSARKYYANTVDNIPQNAFEYAASKVSERFLDSLHHFALRNNFPEAELPDIAEQLVEEVDRQLRAWLPCTATKQFDEIGELVRCDCLLKNHGDGHQSSRTYNVESFDKLGESSFTFKPFSCRWKGEFQTNEKYTPVGWFVDCTVLASISRMARTEFVQNHKHVLESQKKLLMHLQKPSIMCLACLMHFPDEVLHCLHTLCNLCCKELLVDGTVECPFCNAPSKWAYMEIPSGAGYRILSVSATDALFHALLLQKIEDQIGIPVYQLFDLIVAENAAALSSIGYSILKKNAQQVLAACQEELDENRAATHTYVSFSYPLSHFPPFSKHACSFFPRTRVLGTSKMPRVVLLLGSAVACSYNSQNLRWLQDYEDFSNITIKVLSQFARQKTNFALSCEVLGSMEAHHIWEKNRVFDLHLVSGSN